MFFIRIGSGFLRIPGQINLVRSDDGSLGSGSNRGPGKTTATIAAGVIPVLSEGLYHSIL